MRFLCGDISRVVVLLVASFPDEAIILLEVDRDRDVYLCVYIYIYIYVCVCVCVCVCLSVCLLARLFLELGEWDVFCGGAVRR
jgi:hypothetical protein